MKIEINDEYSNLEEDCNNILNEYSNEQDVGSGNVSINYIDSHGEDGNDPYYESTNNKFKVEIQYLEEDSYINNNSYNEYDKFCYESELNGIEGTDNGKYEKYYDNSCENEYVEECEKKCEEDILIDNISTCPKECIEENGYGSCNEEYNINYPNDYLNNDNQEKSENCNGNENNHKNSEEDLFSCGSDYGNSYNEKCNCSKGTIEVCVKLGDKNGVEIRGAKVNLYELNGVCPKLRESKLTDCNGKAIFENLENGCYRVISLVDRRYFEKPTYITWNEVTIDDCVKDASVCVVNKIKLSCRRR